jgi:hypothetical protein
MAKVLICDRCGTEDHQKDFDGFNIFRTDFNGRAHEEHHLDLCGQCSTEFREFYRVAWAKERTA